MTLTRIDELVATILPRSRLPRHLRPSQLLDQDVEPPRSIASKVEALRELLRNGARTTPLTGRIASSKDVATHFIPKLGADSLESIWIIGLDAKHRVRVERQVARGGPCHCMVAPGDLLRVLVLNACPAGVMLHNHPSGDPRPSPDDIALTRRVETGATILGLDILDHVVIGGGDYFSFLDEGLLGAERR